MLQPYGTQEARDPRCAPSLRAPRAPKRQRQRPPRGARQLDAAEQCAGSAPRNAAAAPTLHPIRRRPLTRQDPYSLQMPSAWDRPAAGVTSPIEHSCLTAELQAGQARWEGQSTTAAAVQSSASSAARAMARAEVLMPRGWRAGSSLCAGPSVIFRVACRLQEWLYCPQSVRLAAAGGPRARENPPLKTAVASEQYC